MLHTKFRGNRPAGSGEDFLRIFTIYGHGGHLGHVTSIMSSDGRRTNDDGRTPDIDGRQTIGIL